MGQTKTSGSSFMTLMCGPHCSVGMLSRKLIRLPSIILNHCMSMMTSAFSAIALSAKCASCRCSPIIADAENQFQPFPLTEIQQAYWVARTGAYELGNVDCHIYAEIEFAQLDVNRLNLALQKLIQRHSMLRCVIQPDGKQRILE